MQTTKKILIYVKSSKTDNLRKAEAYAAFFQSSADLHEITTVTSCADRAEDIRKLKQWITKPSAQEVAELVVIGGDGSVNIAAQACVDSKVRLTVIPTGTGNDFASALGLTHWRWRMQCSPQLRQRSVGSINEYIFINHAGAGISVALRDLQGAWSKRWLKRYSYLWALLRYLFVRPQRRCRITDMQGREWEFQVAAVNRAIGGGIIVYPKATLATDVLGVLQVPRIPRWRQLGALYWLLRKQPNKSHLLSCHEAASFTLADATNIIELDGDAIELQGPAVARVKVNALNVYTQGSEQ